MKLKLLFTTILLVPFFTVIAASDLSAKESPLLSQQALEPHGLTRIWFNQAEIDPVRNKITHAIVEDDTMFVVSDDARLHAIDVKSGKALWSRTAGRRELLVQEPAANSRMVAVVNSAELFVFNRRSGKLLLQAPLPGAASTGPDMSENYVYVPMMGEKIIVYPLEENLQMEREDDLEPGAKSAETDPDNPFGSDEPNTGGHEEEDQVLALIVKQFQEAKQSIFAEEKPEPKEKEIVLHRPIGIPMSCKSFGNLSVKPLLTSQVLLYTKRNHVRTHRETLTWVTDRGFFFAAEIDSLSQEQFNLQYMVDSSSQTFFLGSDRIAHREWTRNKEIVTRPTANQCVPFLYTSDQSSNSKIPSLAVSGSRGAYVFAVRDRTGEVEWQFAANGPILERIAVIGTDVYCPTSPGGLHALNLLDGEQKWFTPDIRKFIAASEKRLYTVDDRSRLVVLDRETGNPLSSFDIRRYDQILFNVETDRIYMINESGLIQCLAERQLRTDDEILGAKSFPVIRHRLSCMQYADILRGEDPPGLYWVDPQDNADLSGKKAEKEESDDAPAEKESDPDNDNEKEEEEEEEDPFS